MLLIGVECVIFAHVFECFFSFRRAWSGFAIVAVAVCTVKEKHFRLFIQVGSAQSPSAERLSGYFSWLFYNKSMMEHLEGN